MLLKTKIISKTKLFYQQMFILKNNRGHTFCTFTGSYTQTPDPIKMSGKKRKIKLIQFN